MVWPNHLRLTTDSPARGGGHHSDWRFADSDACRPLPFRKFAAASASSATLRPHPHRRADGRTLADEALRVLDSMTDALETLRFDLAALDEDHPRPAA